MLRHQKTAGNQKAVANAQSLPLNYLALYPLLAPFSSAPVVPFYSALDRGVQVHSAELRRAFAFSPEHAITGAFVKFPFSPMVITTRMAIATRADL